MADQAINALSTKTAPETSDQLLLVGTGEPQLIDYDKLADAILNKITSKNYALDAGQMTLLAAINKLNSDSQMKKNFINPESTDDIIYGTTATIGFYKTGRTASIYFNIEAKQMLASNSFVTIANVPDSYLPEQNIILNYITQKGTPMLVNINKTKKIISLFNNNTEIKNDWVIRQVITYLSAS